jgi:hypothetical protein
MLIAAETPVTRYCLQLATVPPLTNRLGVTTTSDTVTLNSNNITYTYPTSTRRFVQLKVVGP